MKTYIIGICCLLFPLTMNGQITDSLNTYLREAIEHHPQLKADYAVYEATLERLPQAAALDDPTLEMGFFLQPMEIIGGRQVANFKLMQMFPWFGTQKAAREEAAEMAKMEYERFRMNRDNLLLQVKTQWYELNRLHTQLRAINEQRTILHQLLELKTQKYAAGNASSGTTTQPPMTNTAPATATDNMGMAMGNRTTMSPTSNRTTAMNMSTMAANAPGMSDVLQLHMELNELDNRIERLSSDLQIGKNRFNVLLNRPTNQPLLLPDSMQQAHLPMPLGEVLPLVKEQNPMMGMIRSEIASFKAQERMNRKMGLPMLGIGLEYSLVARSKSMSNDSHMSGMDMWMPMVSVSIPLYRKKYNARIKESRLRQEAASWKYEQTQRELEAEVMNVETELHQAQRDIDLYRRQTALAESTLRLAVRQYLGQTSTLNDVLLIHRQLLDLAIQQADAEAQYNGVIAKIENLISTSILK